MPPLSNIIQKPISGECSVEGDSVIIIRTTNFTNEGKIDFSNVATVGIFSKKLNSHIIKREQ
jgi:type I restriction enzyme, S subunit